MLWYGHVSDLAIIYDGFVTVNVSEPGGFDAGYVVLLQAARCLFVGSFGHVRDLAEYSGRIGIPSVTDPKPAKSPDIALSVASCTGAGGPQAILP